MKKLLLGLSMLGTVSTFGASLELPEVSKSQLEDVSNEFAVNFSHTVVAAPETDGLWGVEVGLIAGRTGSPELEDLVDAAGEDGSDFQNIYHAGLGLRGHFPFDLFLEINLLPEREISDVTVENRSFGLGWNAGSFFGLPLDLAAGWNFSNTEVSFKQVINNSSTGNNDVDSKINFKAKSSVLWVGASKTFLFVTPYVKTGVAKTESEIDIDATTGTIFTFSSSQKEEVSSSGGYLAAGANLQFAFFKLGLEASQTIGVKRVSGKLSIDF